VNVRVELFPEMGENILTPLSFFDNILPYHSRPGGNELMPYVRFSILIACYNQRDFIRDAVDSALLQRDPSMEIIAGKGERS
jgi:hypothetical protein